MSQSSDDSAGGMLHHHGVQEIQPDDFFAAEVVAAMAAWSGSEEEIETLRQMGLRLFLIDREGTATAHHPSESANNLSEGFFREFAERDGLWEREWPSPRCFEIHFRALNEDGVMRQLVMPIGADGQPSRLVVATA